MSRKVDYFVKEDILSPDEVCELLNYDARMVPHTIRALYGLTGRSFWVDKPTWIEANNRLALQIERLLMPCGDALISEIRALRNGNLTPPEARDPSIDPFSLNLVSLRSLEFPLYNDTQSVAYTLQDIRDALRSEEDGETLIAVLRAIAAIVVGI